MTTKTDGLNVRANHRKRLRIVEGLYIDGYGAQEIHDILRDRYPDTHGKIQYQTVRSDVSKVLSAWAADWDAQDQINGRLRYLSATRDLRRKALEEGSASALKLMHSLDQELARLCGVNLKMDDKTLRIDIQKAEDFMEHVMEIFFDVIVDTDLRETFVGRLETLAVAD